MERKDDRTGRDRALVEAVRSGREGAFAALVERHQRLVWHLVYRMVRHPEDCRELCQEVFIRVHAKLGQFRFDSSLATWIGKIAFSICARHLQRKRLPLLESGEDDTPPVETAADDFDLAAACADQQLLGYLQEALEELPPISRTVLTLYYLEEMSVGEVSEIMDKPEGTIKNLLFRARNRLRSEFNRYLEPSDE
ncbi:RNA polymerase sigma factor [Wenzhouxiangella sediminis]|uniref:Sigma-70 family RNA polymerase sigma factor n=1 Tax=Wenzhouxiangella sediminis TaxID=1792836 RepID=A0A3E1K6B7_9GAMM|nr:sigma-70 family RNA polymerase sigma factor [Wenzhouxiangella sediminis]RFF29500.1 sigma-70 family RNA polymerase sigma factor [Wenzhouxiangella sediminis]